MIRFLIGPAVFGILTFLIVFFIAPMMIAEADIVAGVAGPILEFSNRHWATTPPIIASYIAILNLGIVAVTAGILMTVVAQLLVIVQVVLVCLYLGIRLLLRWERKPKAPGDLPPIDIDARYLNSGEPEKILGRGLDSIDRDR